MGIVDQWNSLPSNIVEAKTVNSFQRRLDKLWRDQPVYYNYRDTINPTGYDQKKTPKLRRIRAGPKGRDRPSTRRGFVSICEYVSSALLKSIILISQNVYQQRYFIDKT